MQRSWTRNTAVYDFRTSGGALEPAICAAPRTPPPVACSRAADTAEEFDVTGRFTVYVVTHDPIAVVVTSNSQKTVLPVCLKRAELTVKVAVPQTGERVKAVHAVCEMSL